MLKKVIIVWKDLYKMFVKRFFFFVWFCFYLVELVKIINGLLIFFFFCWVDRKFFVLLCMIVFNGCWFNLFVIGCLRKLCNFVNVRVY